LDDWVDRPEVEARQRVELTGTNRPSGLASTLWPFGRFRMAAEIDDLRPLCGSRGAVGLGGSWVCALGRAEEQHLNRVSVAIAKGKHPVPFRTRKLSPSAPMVLRGRLRGRVGRRRTSSAEGRHRQVMALSVFWPDLVTLVRTKPCS